MSAECEVQPSEQPTDHVQDQPGKVKGSVVFCDLVLFSFVPAGVLVQWWGGHAVW